MQKAAIVVLADPRSGSEEALGRLFNALAAAYDFKQQNVPMTLLFQGAGTRWAGELANREHPAYQLFAAVKSTVAGVSCVLMCDLSDAANGNRPYFSQMGSLMCTQRVAISMVAV